MGERIILVFDAHLDLAWNAIDWNRDLRLPVAQLRKLEQDAGMTDKGRGCNTVSFPELRRGKVVMFIATVMPRLLRIGATPAIQRFSNMEMAYAACQGQLAYYRVLAQQGLLRWIKDARTLAEHVQQWQGDEQSQTLPLGFILSMEGGDGILSPDQLEEWWQDGLRIVGPAHYGVSPYAHGTSTVGGLFPPGKPLLQEMERLGMVLDITHLADQAFDEALDIYGGPMLASHHNCRALVPDQRQISDDQIKRLVARGGVIGTALDDWMLYPGWVRGQSAPTLVKLEDMCDHIDHVCQLAGTARHAAIGTDLDGGYGKEQSPYDLDTIADLQRVPAMLRRRGYKEADIEGIMHGNWVRFFTEAWKKLETRN